MGGVIQQQEFRGRQVICFGEALVDFLNTDESTDGDLPLKVFTQFPGGAPANVAVAVAKLGGQAFFAGQLGSDPFGCFLKESLQYYGVDTRFTEMHPTAKTPLAFVFLDQRGERSFLFHRDQTADIIYTKNQVSNAWFEHDSILHYCSNTLTNGSIAEVTQYVVRMARAQQALISFDVNLRHNLWENQQVDRNTVNEFVHQSDLVKLELRELDFLSMGDTSTYLQGCFSEGVKAVLVTNGGDSVHYYTRDASFTVDPPTVEVLDSTGGGDAFIGAVLFGISQQTDPISFVAGANNMAPIVEFASLCGALTVSRQGAFPALPVIDEVRHLWKS